MLYKIINNHIKVHDFFQRWSFHRIWYYYNTDESFKVNSLLL
jgi:hypothetical protein